LISAPAEKKVEEIRKKRVDYVSVDTPATEVAYLMEKYNMEAIPVIDNKTKLVGRITVDDVMDFVRDTAEENYNLASGILDDVEE
jgi:magnesium transporter